MSRLTSFILTASLIMPLTLLHAAKVADLPGEKSKDKGQKSVTLNALVSGQNTVGAATTANKTTRLQLELVKTESAPVIGANHPDARDIPAGFEAGTTVKVTIGGKNAYHMVSTTMETLGPTRWANMRTEHWISEDGNTWRRHKILFRPGTNPETGMWELTGSPFFFFDEKEDRWFVYFNFMAYDRIRPWSTPTLLRRAGSKTNGVGGINGEFNYPGVIVAPSGVAHPTDAAASSISPPFQAADRKWYAFLGGGPKPFNVKSGKWWVLIVKAKGPEGPFIYMPEHAPEPFMDPTGFVENPLIAKIKGPVTGKEYWTVIFDFLQPEVTTGNNSQLGFSCSTDGLTWPVGNAQIINMDKGLPAGTNAWWRAIRVPHQLIDEGNGLYTCFFSAYDKQGEFESIGKATFRVKEIVE
jgi:hypothetical protein